MPSPTSHSAVALVRESGQRNIDALLTDTRCASCTLSYSFPDDDSSWSNSNITGYGSSIGDGEPWRNDFDSLSTAGKGDDRVYFAKALQAWANVANLHFVPVADNATVVGDIRAAYTTPDADDGNTVAWAYYPHAAAFAGDDWFSIKNEAATERWNPGSYAYMSVLHELGHALGLKHPFERERDFAAVLPPNLESRSYSLLSYSALPGDEFSGFSFEPTTPMLLDVAAIQYLYGANTSAHTGDDTYAFGDAEAVHQTLWDAGGTDTLQYSGSLPVTLNLHAGAGSMIGLPVYGLNSAGDDQQRVANVWIAYGTTLENASGGAGNDTLKGNNADNRLTGGAGNDILDGGAGIDTAVYISVRGASVMRASTTGWTVQSSSTDGTDQLSAIERLAFADQQLALDLQATEHGGQALTFIGLMAPGLISSPKAVGVVLNLFDQGQTLLQVSQLALDVGLVADLAGASTNAALAAMVFFNLVGAPAISATIDTLSGYMDGRYASYSQAKFIEVASMLEENLQHIDLVGLQQTGAVFEG